MSDFVLEVSAWLGAIINRVFCPSGSLEVGYMYPHMHITPQHTFGSYVLVCPVDTNLEPVVMNFRPCLALPVQQPGWCSVAALWTPPIASCDDVVASNPV